MPTIEFLVQGSAELPYRVAFSHDGGSNLTAVCTCPAGLVKQFCKHRVAILTGELADIVSGNAEDAYTVQQWYEGSDVERAIQQITDLEFQLDQIKKKLTQAKKMVAQAMHD